MGSSKKGGPRRGRTTSSREGNNSGRWTERELELFEEGLKKHGKQWKLIAMEIPSRTIVQIRTHAQKHFLRLAKSTPNLSTSIAHVSSTGNDAVPKKSTTSRNRASQSTTVNITRRPKSSSDDITASPPAVAESATLSNSPELRRTKSSGKSPTSRTAKRTVSSSKAQVASGTAARVHEKKKKQQQPTQQQQQQQQEVSRHHAKPQAPTSSRYMGKLPSPPPLIIKIPSVESDYGGMPSLLPPMHGADYRSGLPSYYVLPSSPTGSHNKPSPTSVADCYMFPGDSSVTDDTKCGSVDPSRRLPAVSSSFDARWPTPAYLEDSCTQQQQADHHDDDDDDNNEQGAMGPEVLTLGQGPISYGYGESYLSTTSTSSSNMYESSSSSSSSSSPVPVMLSSMPAQKRTVGFISASPSDDSAATVHSDDSMVMEPAAKRQRYHAPPTARYSHQHNMAQQEHDNDDVEDALFANLVEGDGASCLDFGVLDEVLGLLTDDDMEAMRAASPPAADAYGAIHPAHHHSHHVLPMMVGPATGGQSLGGAAIL